MRSIRGARADPSTTRLTMYNSISTPWFKGRRRSSVVLLGGGELSANGLQFPPSLGRKKLHGFAAVGGNALFWLQSNFACVLHD